MDPLTQTLIDAGLLDYQEATLLWAMLSPEEARRQAEALVEAAFAQGLSSQQARLLTLLQKTDYQPTNKQLGAFWGGETKKFWAEVEPTILDQMSQAATLAAVGSNVADWETVAEQALNFARTYYLDGSNLGAIPSLNETSRRMFEGRFSQWLAGELPGQGGRTQAGTLTGRGLPDLIASLEPVFGPTRAERIAVTETTRIWTQAQRVADRNVEEIAGYRLLTSADDRVCEICGPLYGQTREKGVLLWEHPSMGPIQGPPFHPRCRCQETPETLVTLEIPWEEGRR